VANKSIHQSKPRLYSHKLHVTILLLFLISFNILGVCPSNKHRHSSRCANAAKAVGKDLDIFPIEAVSLNHIYAYQPKLLITFVHNCNVLCYVVLSYHVLVTSLHLCLFVCFFVYFSRMIGDGDCGEIGGMKISRGN
jgi:hypothetical protein